MLFLEEEKDHHLLASPQPTTKNDNQHSQNLRHQRCIEVGDDHRARLVSQKWQQTLNLVVELQENDDADDDEHHDNDKGLDFAALKVFVHGNVYDDGSWL